MSDYEGSRRQFLELIAQHDAPAFVHRSQSVLAAEGQLFGTCHRQRGQLLKMPGMRLAKLEGLLANRWNLLEEHLASAADPAYLRDLFVTWQPQLRLSVPPARSRKQVAQAIEQLADSFRRFNRQWQRFVNTLDTTEVNRARRDFNAYYVIEKGAALQSEVLAARGFEAMPPLTLDGVLERFPYLLVPVLRAS